MMLRRLRMAGAWCLAWLTLGTVSWGADTPPVSRWISATDTIFYAEIAHPDMLIDRATSESLREIAGAVPGLEESLRSNESLREALQVVRYLSEAMDTTPIEGLRTLVGNGLVLAVEGSDASGQHVYLVVTPKDVAFLEATHEKLLALARLDAEGKGRPDPVKEADYRGVHGYSLDDKEAHAIIQGSLVIANGGDAMKALIDRIEDQGGAESPLNEDATWKARRDSVEDDAAGWAYLNLQRLREADPDLYAPDKVDAGALFVFGPWIESLQRGGWASLGLTWTEQRIAVELALDAPEGGHGSAMAGYLPGEGRGAQVPLEVPGVIATGTLWRDLSAIWEARGEIFPPEAQQGFAQLDTFAGTFFGGRDFGSGVLGALGNQWRVVVARQETADLDPVPDMVLPTFAIVVDVPADDPDFVQRLKAAFQSFIGLANLGAAETKAPPLMIGSEEFAGLTIATSHFLPPRDRAEGEPVHQRHNFSPSAVQVGDHFVLSSSLPLARELVKTLQASDAEAAATTDATLLMKADGHALAGLIDQNRERLVMQNMLEKGNDRDQAEGEVSLLKSLVTYLGEGSITATDTPDGLRLNLNFDLGQP